MPSARRIPVRISERAWKADLASATAAGAEAARAARRRYTRGGVPLTELHACDAEGRDGARLPESVKVYLPQPAGPFGMVFQFRKDGDALVLMFLAFGVRHHPRGAHAATVYERAHQRLHGQPPN